jgi:hypothetical protein
MIQPRVEAHDGAPLDERAPQRCAADLNIVKFNLSGDSIGALGPFAAGLRELGATADARLWSGVRRGPAPRGRFGAKRTHERRTTAVVSIDGEHEPR